MKSNVFYFTLLAFALANPLPLPPRPVPCAMPPRLAPAPPLFSPELGREEGAGVANLELDLDETGGLSTKEVSVVLENY